MPNDSTNSTNTTNADTFAFQYEGTDITLTRAELDALSVPLQLAAHAKYMASLGRLTGPGRGNFFKRWKGLFDEGGGYEFRPFLNADYGYPEDFGTYSSTALWILETFGNFQVGKKEGAIVGAISLLLNELVIHNFIPIDSGSSFVWNIQGGFNLYHWFKNKKKKRMQLPALGVLAGDAMYVAYENHMGFGFGERVAHTAHAAGLGIGLFLGIALNRLL